MRFRTSITQVNSDNSAEQCRLGLFQDSDFARDLEDSKPTSEGILFIYGSRSPEQIRWTCKKQTAVSHSSTESQVKSLDVCLRMDGILAFDFVGIGHRSPALITER